MKYNQRMARVAPECFIGICCSPVTSCQLSHTSLKRKEVREHTKRKRHRQHRMQNPSLHLTLKRMTGDAWPDGPKETLQHKPGATSDQRLQRSSHGLQHQHRRETTGQAHETL